MHLHEDAAVRIALCGNQPFQFENALHEIAGAGLTHSTHSSEAVFSFAVSGCAVTAHGSLA
jgi:hypothetical protein